MYTYGPLGLISRTAEHGDNDVTNNRTHYYLPDAQGGHVGMLLDDDAMSGTARISPEGTKEASPGRQSWDLVCGPACKAPSGRQKQTMDDVPPRPGLVGRVNRLNHRACALCYGSSALPGYPSSTRAATPGHAAFQTYDAFGNAMSEAYTAAGSFAWRGAEGSVTRASRGEATRIDRRAGGSPALPERSWYRQVVDLPYVNGVQVAGR